MSVRVFNPLVIVNLNLMSNMIDAFDYLDAPPERITGADVPMPYAYPLEEEAMVQPHNIINAVKRVCYRAQQ